MKSWFFDHPIGFYGLEIVKFPVFSLLIREFDRRRLVRIRLHHPPTSQCEPIPVVASFRGLNENRVIVAGQGVDEAILKIALDENALSHTAHLSGQHTETDHRGGDGGLEIGVGKHHVRRLAAELQ
jgi:hypothetical protein